MSQLGCHSYQRGKSIFLANRWKQQAKASSSNQSHLTPTPTYSPLELAGHPIQYLQQPTMASDQIRQMVNFILQEAHEKANEIRVKVGNMVFDEMSLFFGSVRWLFVLFGSKALVIGWGAGLDVYYIDNQSDVGGWSY